MQRKRGISLTISNGELYLYNEKDNKGLLVESYSISYDKPETIMEDIPNVPFLAVVEMQFRKKGTSIVNFYTRDDIITMAKQEKEGGIK